MSDMVKTERETAGGAEPTRSGANYSPRIDILETDSELTLYADLPGVRASGIELRFDSGELTLYGPVPARNEGVDYLHHEYGIGDFQRSFSVGSQVDASKINAEMNNGVLTVHLPKTEAVKPKRIEVQSS